jgi:predicted nucleic acid-binding protein
VSPRALDTAQVVLGLVVQLEIDEGIRQAAAKLPPVGLRSQDAIHLASALLLRDEMEAVLVYDAKLSEACKHAGLKVEAPAPD